GERVAGPPVVSTIAPPPQRRSPIPLPPLLPQPVLPPAPARVLAPATAIPPLRGAALRPPAAPVPPSLLARARVAVATAPVGPRLPAPLQISIGRIEVRAQPARAPEWPVRRPGPPPNLAHYRVR